jgi:carbonic anhydrase/acetyltransferase-like protein (isoleucine patch superfamily)
MTDYIKKLRAGRVSNANVATWIGESGTIFYNESNGQLKIADGVTPGGHYIGVPVATTTQLGGIKAGAGANVSVDGTLTINTAGLPLGIGNLSFVDTTISVVNANENLILATNGSGNVDLVGNVNFHTTAAPTGNPLFSVDNFGNVIVNGKLIINGASYFFGNETNFGNITVNGITTFNGDTIRTGNTIQSGAVTITGNSVNNGTSTFNGNSIFNGNVYHTGFTSFIGDVSHLGNIVITGQTTNNGLSIFNGDLVIAGNARLVGNTSITGNTLVTGNTFVLGTTTVTGNTLVTGTTTVTGNTLVTGNTFVVGTTTVAGNTFVVGTTTVTGNTLVTGNTFVLGTTTVTGNTYVTGNTFVTGTTTVLGNTYVTGQVTTITGNTYLQGNSFVTGTISITGNSVQTGLATYIVNTVNSTQGAVEITGDIAGSYQTPINQGVMLQVTGQASLPSRIYNDGQNNYPSYIGRRYNGNVTTPTQVLNNQDVLRVGGTGYTSNGWQGNGIARISLTANEDQTLTNQGSRIELWVTPNGSNASSISNVVTVTSNLMSVNANIITTGTITGNLIGNVTGTSTKSNVATNLTAASAILAGQVNIPAQTIAKNTTSVDVTVTVTGLTTSHKVMVTPAADLNAGIFVSAGYPTTANTLGIQLQNTTGGAITTSAFSLTYWAWI